MNKLNYLILSLICFSFWACQPKPKGGALENTHWKLHSIKEGNKLSAMSGGVDISAVFSDKNISGISVCNRYSAHYSTDGAKLEVGDITATERMCDGINIENTFLNILSKANAYTASQNELVVFSEVGKLTFSPMSEQEISDIQYADGIGKLAAMFPPVEGGALHLYPIVRVDRPGNYPYKGKLIDPSLYQFFDPGTSEVWNSTGGDVMAVGKYGDFYICRVPGRYVSSDIALFRLQNGEMKRTETVAWAWCDEGWCNQQDAWLKDVNKDGKTDIVQHYTLTDDKGKVKEERMTVLLQNGNGTFKQAEGLQPDKSSFKMAGI